MLHEKFGFLYVNAINTALIFTFIFGNLPCILSDGPLADVRILNRSVFDAYDFIYNLWYQFVRFVIPVIILAIFIYGLIPLFS